MRDIARYSSFFFIFLSNVKYVTYGRSVVESKIAAGGGESAGWWTSERRWEKGSDTHGRRGISYRSSRNLRATIRVVVVSTVVDTEWIKRLWRPSGSWIMQRRDPIYNSRKRNMCYVGRAAERGGDM